jgi:hypothetical protein
MVCKVMPPVRHKLQKQQQKLIHKNKKNRILIVYGDNPDNYATLKLDLERNGFIVDTFTDPLVAQFQSWLICYGCVRQENVKNESGLST